MIKKTTFGKLSYTFGNQKKDVNLTKKISINRNNQKNDDQKGESPEFSTISFSIVDSNLKFEFQIYDDKVTDKFIGKYKIGSFKPGNKPSRIASVTVTLLEKTPKIYQINEVGDCDVEFVGNGLKVNLVNSKITNKASSETLKLDFKLESIDVSIAKQKAD